MKSSVIIGGLSLSLIMALSALGQTSSPTNSMGGEGLIQSKPGTIRGAIPQQSPAPVQASPGIDAAHGRVTLQTEGLILTQPGTIEASSRQLQATLAQATPGMDPSRAQGLVSGVTNAHTGAVDSSAGADSAGAKVLVRSPQWGPNGFSCSIASQTGRVYALEYKESPGQVAWSTLPPVAGNGTVMTLQDSAALATHRVYRVRQW